MPSKKTVRFSKEVGSEAKSTSAKFRNRDDDGDAQTDRPGPSFTGPSGLGRSGAAGGRSDPLPSKEDADLKAKGKHSLDSDEEEEAHEEKLTESDIEGEEEETITYDEGIEIMPFNMREELATGHFDKNGTYIFEKEENVADNWLEKVDWNEVKARESTSTKRSLDEEEEDPLTVDDNVMENQERGATLKDMVAHMKPGETVARALRRLGGGKQTMSASQRLKARKKAKLSGDDPTAGPSDEEKANNAAMLSLAEMADKMVQCGDLEVYEDTYERLMFKARLACPEVSAATLGTASGADDSEMPDLPSVSNEAVKPPANNDSAMDMFASDEEDNATSSSDINSSKDVPETESAQVPKEPNVGETTPNADTNTEEISTSSLGKEDEVHWLYKWEDKEGVETHGPYSSTDMMQWVEAGYFGDGVFVQKVTESEGPWYKSARIDFDLYT